MSSEKYLKFNKGFCESIQRKTLTLAIEELTITIYYIYYKEIIFIETIYRGESLKTNSAYTLEEAKGYACEIAKGYIDRLDINTTNINITEIKQEGACMSSEKYLIFNKGFCEESQRKTLFLTIEELTITIYYTYFEARIFIEVSYRDKSLKTKDAYTLEEAKAIARSWAKEYIARLE